VRFFLCEGLRVKNAVYGIYHPDYDAHVYRDLEFDHIDSEPINRGHDDESIQFGSFTYERLTLTNCRTGRDPIIQMACTAPKPGVTGHFKDLRITNCQSPSRIVDLGSGPRNDRLQFPVTYCFLAGSSPGAGLPEPLAGDLMVVSRRFPAAMQEHEWREIAGWTGRDVLAAVVQPLEFPILVEPKDDLPPATLITAVRRDSGRLHVTGISHDNGTVAAVTLNGFAASITSQQAGIAEWEITMPAAAELTAVSRDRAGNIEQWPHRTTAAH
jgi:hypothetical protein